MECSKQVAPQCSPDHYPNDKCCKECRRQLVRENRAKNADYYREYDKRRYKDDPRVRERHRKYQQSEAGKESIRVSRAKYAMSFPIKRGASHMVNNAVRDGKMFKPDSCSECGAEGRLHGHHDDYAKPLDVRWLCVPCHSAWHKENGEGKNAD